MTNSALLFPKTIGGDPTAKDLVNQVIQYELPILNMPITGKGAPIVLVTNSRSPNPIEQKQVGRDTIDAQGPEVLTLEYYIIAIAQGKNFKDAQIQVNNIVQAITTTLDTHKRLTDLSNANPICRTLQWISVPFLLPENDQKEIMAFNTMVRPEPYVNLR
ncbi:MAG: hypothetical protein KGI08_03580 [Thaumarchaeota archaeon]|nr:hypothetical protein [Nitrososphaerota archaeon]